MGTRTRANSPGRMTPSWIGDDAPELQAAGGGVERDAGKIQVALVGIAGLVGQADEHRVFVFHVLLRDLAVSCPGPGAGPAR